MPKLIIITVFNNIELYEQMKASVLETKNDVFVEFYGIDNTTNKYSSAASAYNEAIKNICNEDDILLFCHQDLIFKSNTINMFYNLCTSDANTVFGAAGATECKRYYNKPKKKVRVVTTINDLSEMEKSEIIEVFTIDELLIVGKAKIFKDIMFDEKTCDDWHLYVADFCLQCHIKGYGVKVLGCDLIHLSAGIINKAFRRAEKRLARKYAGVYPIINYTCGSAYTNCILYYLFRLYSKIKPFIKKTD